MTELPQGTRLGAYEIVRHIASGGMGSVYESRNRITGEVRALKVMRPDLASQRDFVQRFIREIKLTMSLEHPNLVRVYEPGMDGDRVFLPMELLAGETLAKYMKRRGKLPEKDALAIVFAVGSALAALHERGIIHRDVKPSNVFLSSGPSGEIWPKLLDLGAARTAEVTEELTATGLAIGSPHYMAPEQAAGAKQVDHHADQYSLGITLYQMLTATRPYENDDTGHALAKLLANASYPSPRALEPSISPAVEAVILRAMRRNPEERFASIREMLAALEAATRPSGQTRIAPLAPPAPAMMVPVMASRHPDPDTTGPVALSRERASTGKWVVIAASLVVIVVGSGLIAARALGWLVPSEPKTSTLVAAPPAITAAPAMPAPAPSSTAPVAVATPAATETVATAKTATTAPPTTSVRNAALAATAPTGSARAHSTAASAAPCVATPGSPCL